MFNTYSKISLCYNFDLWRRGDTNKENHEFNTKEMQGQQPKSLKSHFFNKGNLSSVPLLNQKIALLLRCTSKQE